MRNKRTVFKYRELHSMVSMSPVPIKVTVEISKSFYDGLTQDERETMVDEIDLDMNTVLSMAMTAANRVSFEREYEMKFEQQNRR